MGLIGAPMKSIATNVTMVLEHNCLFDTGDH